MKLHFNRRYAPRFREDAHRTSKSVELLEAPPFASTPDGKSASIPPLNIRPVPSAAMARRPVALNLYSTPSAAVFVDSADLGRTTPQLCYEPPAGAHSVRLVSDNGEEQMKFTIKPGQGTHKDRVDHPSSSVAYAGALGASSLMTYPRRR